MTSEARALSPLPLDGLLEVFATRVEVLPSTSDPHPDLPREGGGAGASGRVRLTMQRTDVTVGGVRNSINGGVVAAFAELAAHCALRTLLADGEVIEGTQETNLSYITSAVGAETVAEATVLRKGGRLCVVDVDVRDGGTGELNAKSRTTLVLARTTR